MNKIKTKRPSTTFRLPRQDMIEALDRISSCIMEDEEHPGLCGALEASDGKVRLVATDGHRLGYAEVTMLDGTPPSQGVTIPGAVVRMLIDRLPTQSEAAVAVAVDAGAFRIECRHIVVGDELIAKPFPDYRKVLAKLDDGEFADVVFDPSALYDIAKDAVDNTITINIQDDHMVVEEYVTVDDKVPCTAPQGWTPRTIRINRGYLADALGPFFNTNVATMRVVPSPGEHPVSFEAASIPGLRYIVMPMRH